MDVVVLHVMGHLMERQLDPSAGYLLLKDLERRGIEVHVKAQTKAILGHNRVEAVLLEDGTVHDADIVVMAVGIRPETRIARDAGLEIARGIVVDDAMRTSDPAILAVGECVEHEGILYGLVVPLYDQPRVVAKTLFGEEVAFAAVGSRPSSRSPVRPLLRRRLRRGVDREEIVFRDVARGVYKRLVLEDERLVGAVMYGDTADGSWFFSKIRAREDVSAGRDTLIFGPAYAGGAALDPMAAVAALPDEAEICGCNGVCKGRIIQAVTGGRAEPSMRCGASPRLRPPAASAPGSWSRCWRSTLGDGFELRRRSRCASAPT